MLLMSDVETVNCKLLMVSCAVTDISIDSCSLSAKGAKTLNAQQLKEFCSVISIRNFQL